MNAGVGTGKRSDHQHTLGWNQILDGAASMVGNSQHVRHAPTVKMTDTSVSFVLPTSGKSGAIDEGIVVATRRGSSLTPAQGRRATNQPAIPNRRA
jgi:hypothetical protein